MQVLDEYRRDSGDEGVVSISLPAESHSGFVFRNTSGAACTHEVLEGMIMEAWKTIRPGSSLIVVKLSVLTP